PCGQLLKSKSGRSSRRYQLAANGYTGMVPLRRAPYAASGDAGREAFSGLFSCTWLLSDWELVRELRWRAGF
nr:hypothetical protein [Tanacetum cinerariifolium]